MNALKNIDREMGLKVAVFVGTLVLIFMTVFSMIETSTELDGKLTKERKKLQEIKFAAERYTALSQTAPASFKNSSSTNLTSEVETVARKAGIKGFIKKISPKPDGRELTISFSGLQLHSLVGFLKSLKLSPLGISVRRALVKQSFENKDTLEVNLTLTKGF